MAIVNLLNQIDRGEIVLPAIQRDFVWGKDRIEALLDSIMRGYPIGIILLWETFHQIQYRDFVKDYLDGSLYPFRENHEGSKLRLVLDGQQRLQSLYVALYGTHKGRAVYLDVLSGQDGDDLSKERFEFELLPPRVAQEQNEATRDEFGGDAVSASRKRGRRYWVGVAELFKMSVGDRRRFLRELSDQLSLSDEDVDRVDTNMARFDEALTKDENILKSSIIDENRPPDYADRKTEADILEIFVRVNTQGLPLSRSDLIFSIMKLNWKGSAEALPEFVKEVNEGHSIQVTNDFVIRSLLAVSDLGARFDLDLLRKKSNVELMRRNYEACCDAIRASVDFAVNECRCSSAQLIAGTNTLVPLVYYLFRHPRTQVPDAELEAARKSFYLFALGRPFARYGDSRLSRYIRESVKPRADKDDWSWPMDDAVEWLDYWEGIDAFDQRILESNVPMVLHLIQGLSGTKTQYVDNAPEVDHIFPRAELRKKNHAPAEINHPANFWILARGKNRNKSNKHPKRYFDDVSERTLKRALIDREMLDYRRFRSFLEVRAMLMLGKLQSITGITERDFESLYEEDEDAERKSDD